MDGVGASTDLAADRAHPDVWAAAARATDVGLSRPRLAAGVEHVHFTTRWGAGYTMAKAPARGARPPAYLRFDEDEGAILDQLDGSRTVRELVVERLGERDDFDPETVAVVVEVLEQAGFLERPWVDTDELLRQRTKAATTRWSDRLRAAFRSQTVRFRRADVWAGWLYRHGGRFAFTRTGSVVLLVLFLAGIGFFVDDVRSGRFRLSSEALVTSAGLLLVLDIVATIIHELGHALAIRRAGRTVLSAGFQLYLGHPAFFIDSADIMLSPPRDRIRQAWFGPYASFVVAGVAATLAWLFPHAGISHVLFNLAVLTYYTVLLNLIPFLELDGYWMLTDALQTADLRPRSLAFLRRELPGRIRRRERLSRFEWALVGFGTLGAIFTVFALVTSYVFWGAIFRGFSVAMWEHGWWGRAALVLLAVFVLGPLVHGAWHWGELLVERARFAVARRRFSRELGWRRDAGLAIAQLPLLDDLTLDAVNELAGRVSLRRAEAGEVVVRRGERADAFYVVRSGTLHVVDELPEGDQAVLRRLGEGEAFGELALLQGGRRTATVVAATATELYVVDKGSFDRLLASYLVVPELATSVGSVQEVWSLAPFRHLSAGEARTLAEQGRWESHPPGAAVVRQGETGDAFYVVGSGRLDVSAGTQHLRELGAGDHFGEVALLLDVPRTATVTARTPVRLFVLDRAAFERVVARSFRSRRLGSTGGHELPERT